MTVFRDGKIHTLDAKCDTCVFRGGDLMHIGAERFTDLIKSNLAQDGVLTCHQTLEANTLYDAEEAVCRGYFDAYQRDVTALRTAVGLDVLAEDPQPTKRKRETA